MINEQTAPVVLNDHTRILWFDDFNEPGHETNGHRFLSNFYVGEPIALAGDYFATGEHAFQAAKAKTPKVFGMVRDADSPGHAKALGRSVPLRDDWELVKYDVMAAVVRAKFTPRREEGKLLLETGDRLLVEGTYWGDTVWGTNLNQWRRVLPPGRNWLGTLLMARRAELRAHVELQSGLVGEEANLEFAWKV